MSDDRKTQGKISLMDSEGTSLVRRSAGENSGKTLVLTKRHGRDRAGTYQEVEDCSKVGEQHKRRCKGTNRKRK